MNCGIVSGVYQRSFALSLRRLSPATGLRKLYQQPSARLYLCRAEPTPQETVEKTNVDDCAYNIGEYCSIDDDGTRVETRTVGEMEQEFIAAMQAWYFEGKSIMTDEEFENLKDELTWQGSSVVLLSSAEQRFLEASVAYSNGNPLMTDKEYDDLKLTLKSQGSSITLAGPRCSLRSRIMYSDLQVDYLRMTALNIPAATLVLSVLFFFDDVTGFEISKLIELPEPWGILVLWGIVLPTCFILSQQLTNFVLRDGVILKGECPNCGAENRRYFGSIFGVEGSTDVATSKCVNCETKLEFRNQQREIVVVPT